MQDLVLYHTSSETSINTQQRLTLGKIFQACIVFKAFVVGYNVLEVANGDDRVLLAFLMKNEPGLKEGFEHMTNLKLVKVERKENVEPETRG